LKRRIMSNSACSATTLGRASSSPAAPGATAHVAVPNRENLPHVAEHLALELQERPH